MSDHIRVDWKVFNNTSDSEEYYFTSEVKAHEKLVELEEANQDEIEQWDYEPCKIY